MQNSQKKIPHKQIKDFDIQMELDKLVIASNPLIKDKHRLEGVLILDLADKLEGIKQIQFRFVGGIAISLKLEDDGFHFHGTERLFDQTVILSDAKELEAKKHEFPFFLALPSGSPPSVTNTRIKIQYLVVAVIGFENGCCGLIPIMQKEPARVKKEIEVVNFGLHSSFSERLKNDGECKLQLLNDSLVWSPNNNLLIKINPIQLPSRAWEFHCQMSTELVLDHVSFEIREHTIYKYQTEKSFNRTADLVKDEVKLLAEGTILDIPPGVISNNERFIGFEFAPKLSDILPDIHSKCAKITHELQLQFHLYGKNETAGHATLVIQTAVLPIQINDITFEELTSPESISETATLNEHDSLEGLRKRK